MTIESKKFEDNSEFTEIRLLSLLFAKETSDKLLSIRPDSIDRTSYLNYGLFLDIHFIKNIGCFLVEMIKINNIHIPLLLFKRIGS